MKSTNLLFMLFCLVVTSHPLFAQQIESESQLKRKIKWQQHDFKLNSNEIIKSELGEIEVPENRNNENSRTIQIRFVKFSTRAENPVSPIIYLAGGPGGSGTSAARGKRWKMFDRLRDIADVIVLDQRGTGMSDGLPQFGGFTSPPSNKPLTAELYTKLLKRELEKAVQFWKAKGTDYRGYTTAESAADIEAIRKGIGARRINLLGISYGTHLALATVKEFPDSVDRLVLVSAEGLDQTAKLPSRTDRYFDRLQSVIDQNVGTAAKYPDIRVLITTVLKKVEANQPTVTLGSITGETRDYVLGKFDIQRITSYMISDPSRVPSILKAYKDADNGNFGYFYRFLGRPIRVRGMPELMDIASGISDERLRLFDVQAKKGLLGEALNFPMPQLRNTLPELDLGEEFRQRLKSDRPALFFSGTLDGRTYPESHVEIANGFSNHSIITVENAGHNLFFSHPDIVQLITDFFEGKAVKSNTLYADLPEFFFK